MRQKDIHQPDPRAALLAAFDSISDDYQVTAMAMLQTLARRFPRRQPVVLSVVGSRLGTRTPRECGARKVE